MNGRVQDAAIGRFISADPYIPDPLSSQSFNRYSYVQNNPLTRIDPSGFDDGRGGIDPRLIQILDDALGGTTPEPFPTLGTQLAPFMGQSVEEVDTASVVLEEKGPDKSAVPYESTPPRACTGGRGGPCHQRPDDPTPELQAVADFAQRVENLVRTGFFRTNAEIEEWGRGLKEARARGSEATSQYLHENPMFTGVEEAVKVGGSGGIAGFSRATARSAVPSAGTQAATAASSEAIVASNGVRIVGFTKHGVNRAIGDAAQRAGTRPEAILDALHNPIKPIVSGIDSKGRPFQTFIGADARVIINPQTGRIVSTNPRSSAGAL